MQAKLQDGNIVALRVFNSDIEDMTEEEFVWVKTTATSCCAIGTYKEIITYNIPINTELYTLLRRRNRNAIKPSLFFTLKRLCDGQDLALEGYDAYDAVTALYSQAVAVLRPSTENWIYSTANAYVLSYRIETKCLLIDFPKNLVGLLIGQKGASVYAVQEFLSEVVSKVKIR